MPKVSRHLARPLGVRPMSRVGAFKFEQEMAVFKGWVRLDATMKGTRATVHESGLVPIEIAIPVAELASFTTGDTGRRPTFNRLRPTGHIEEKTIKPRSDPES